MKTKKHYVELPNVESFMATQSEEINLEYQDIVDELEETGYLRMPTGEKVNDDLFSMRIMQAGNVRVFYVYGKNDTIFGIHGYVKKTQQIPHKELALAIKKWKQLRKGGYV